MSGWLKLFWCVNSRRRRLTCRPRCDGAWTGPMPELSSSHAPGHLFVHWFSLYYIKPGFFLRGRKMCIVHTHQWNLYCWLSLHLLWHVQVWPFQLIYYVALCSTGCFECFPHPAPWQPALSSVTTHTWGTHLMSWGQPGQQLCMLMQSHRR